MQGFTFFRSVKSVHFKYFCVSIGGNIVITMSKAIDAASNVCFDTDGAVYDFYWCAGFP